MAPAVEALAAGKINATLREQISARDIALPESVTVKPIGAANHWLLQAEVDGVKHSFDIKLLEPPVVKDPTLVVAKIISANDIFEADTVWVYDMMTDLGVSQHSWPLLLRMSMRALKERDM